MTTITIKNSANISKTSFDNLYDLYDYILDEHIDFKHISLDNLSDKKNKNLKNQKIF